MKKFDIKMKKRIAYLGAALAVQFGVLPWSVEAAVANDALPVLGTTGSIHKTNGSTPDATFFQGTMGADGKFTPGTQTVNGKEYKVMGIKQDEDVRVGLINWESFNVGRDAMVNIKQYKSSDIMINNVKGHNMSQIYGAINATSNVALINPNGVVFDGAKINVGAFIVSTAPLKEIPADGTEAELKFAQNSLAQGNIDVRNTLIRAGYSAVLANHQNNVLTLPSDFAFNLSSVNNNIRLLADGDVNLQNAKLVATDSATARDTRTEGLEEWGLAASTDGFSGTITIRSDVNSDDLGSVNIATPAAGEENWLIAPKVEVYYNPDLARDKDTGSPTYGKQVLGITDDGRLYTKKDYTKTIDNDFTKVKVNVNAITEAAATSVGVNKNVLKGRHYNTKDGNIVDPNHDDRILTPEEILASPGTQIGGGNVTGYMLINNIAQLQDIDDATYGNMAGKYALGREIDATNDALTYVEEVRIDANNAIKYVHKKDANGNPIISVSDGYFTKDATGETFTKHLNDGTTIGFTKTTDGKYTVIAGATPVLNASTDANGKDSYTIAGLTRIESETVKQMVAGDKLFVKDSTGVSYVKINADGSRDTSTKVNMATADGTVFENTWTCTSVQDITIDKPDSEPDAEGKYPQIKIGDRYTYTSGSDTLTVEKIGEVITSKLGEATIMDALVTARINTAIEDAPTVGSSIEGTSIDGVTKVVSMKNSSNEDVEYRYYNTKENVTVVDYKGSDLSAEAIGVLESNINNITVTKADHKTDTPIKVQALDGANIVDFTFNQDGTVTGTVGGQTVTAKDLHLTDAAYNLLTYNSVYAQINNIDNASNTVTTVDFKGVKSTTTSRPNVFDGSSNTNSSNWWKDSNNDAHGFYPLGKTSHKGANGAPTQFTGILTGVNGMNGPRASTTINNLTIRRSNEDNVGLIADIYNGNVNYVSFKNADVNGGSNVGVVAGVMEGSGHIGAVSVSGQVNGGTRINGAEPSEEKPASNIGGLIGEMKDKSSISWSSNSATVTGRCDDYSTESNIDVKNVGGLVGNIHGEYEYPNATSSDNPSISRSSNSGQVFGEEAVGGIAGRAENAIIGGDTGDYDLTRVYNKANITGKNYVGGLVGKAEGNIKLTNAFNSNQKSTDKSGTVIVGNATQIKTAVAAENTTYGVVTGTEYVGGIVGGMSGNNNMLDSVYNAGNVKGQTNVGGLAGNLTGNSTITNSYNADNNTVISEFLPIHRPTQTTYSQEFENLIATQVVKDVIPYYYDAEAKDKPAIKAEINRLMEYYSFYKLDSEGENPTYYYYVPTNVENDTSRQGAEGFYFYKSGDSYVKLNAAELDAIQLADRYYANRVAYRDANVVGKENVGGVVGLQQGGTISTSYNAGTIKPAQSVTEITYAGGIVGKQDIASDIAVDGYEAIKKSFYVTGTDLSTGKEFSNVTQAVGSNTPEAETALIAKGIKGIDIKNARGGEAIKSSLGVDVAASYFEKVNDIDARGFNIYQYEKTDHTTGNIYYSDAQTYSAHISEMKTKAQGLNLSNVLFYASEDNENQYVVIPVGTKDKSNNELTEDFVMDYADFMALTDISWTGTENITGYIACNALENVTVEPQHDSTGHNIYNIGGRTINYLQPASTADEVSAKLNSLGIDYTRCDVYQDASGIKYVLMPEGTKDVSNKELTAENIVKFSDLQNWTDGNWNANIETIYAPDESVTKANVEHTVIISNQSDTWTSYGDQTLPLLNVFMGPAGLERHFDYDGSVHNLVTDDVEGLYGRADFSGGAGKNVYTPGYENLADNGISSMYYYNTSSVWAPQHGLRTDPKTSVYIVPVDLEIKITGNKIYGEDIQTSLGTVNPENSNEYENYTVTVTGIANQHERDALFSNSGTNQAIINNTLIDREGDTGRELDVFVDAKGNVIAYDSGVVDVGIGTYQRGHAYGENLLYINNLNTDILLKNYNLKLSSSYTVNKANLNYTYEGVRDYGQENGAASTTAHPSSQTYSIAGKDESSIAGNSVNGFLKSFDYDKSVQDADGNDITEMAVLIKAGIFKDDRTLNMSTTNLQLSGHNPYASDKIDQAITSDGANNSYYHVIADGNGNVTQYVVTDIANDSLATLRVTANVEGFSDAEKKVVESFMNNYNLQWIAGGQQQLPTITSATNGKYAIIPAQEGTIEETTQPDPTPTYNICNSTQQINPIGLKVDVAGTQTYTQGMTKDTNGKYSYTIKTEDYSSLGDAERKDAVIGVADANQGKWIINLSGLIESDIDRAANLEVTNDAVIKALLAFINNGNSYDAQKLNDYTYVKREADGTVTVYNLKDNTQLNGSVFDVANVMKLTNGTLQLTEKYYDGTGGSAQFNYNGAQGFLSEANKYDYLIENTSNSLKVKPLSINVKVEGDKIYGQDTSQAFTDTELYDIYTTKNGVKDQQASNVELKVFENNAQGTVTEHNGSLLNLLSLRNDTGTQEQVRRDSDGNVIAYTDKIVANAYAPYYVPGSISIDDAGSYANNYDVTLTSEYTIYPRAVNITTIGERTYGEVGELSNLSYVINQGATSNTTGLMEWDRVKSGAEIEDGRLISRSGSTSADSNAVFKTSDSSNPSLDANAPSYYENRGYLSTEFNIGENKTDANSLNNNYSIVYNGDSLRVNKANLTITITGAKKYGSPDAITGSGYKVEAEHLKNDEVIGTGMVNTDGKGVADKATNSNLIISNTMDDNGGDGYTNDIYLDVGRYGNANGSINITNLYTDLSEDGKDNGSDIGIGFNANNYNIAYVYDYTVTPKDLDIAITGNKIYGQDTEVTKAAENSQYTFETGAKYENGIKVTDGAEGLVGEEQINPNGVTVYNKAHDNDAATGYGQVVYGDTIDNSNSKYLDANTYDGSKSAGSTASELAVYVNENALTGTNGFKASNYTINQTSQYTVTPKTIDVVITGNKIYGEDTGATGSANTESANAVVAGKQYSFEITGLENGETVNGIGGSKSGAIAGLTLNTAKLVDDDAKKPETEAYSKDRFLDAGTYEGTATRNGNGVLVENDKVITVTEANLQAVAGQGGFEANNYVINSIISTYTVDQAQAEVAIGGSKVYGQKDDKIVYGYEIRDLANGEKLNADNKLGNVIEYKHIDASKISDGDAGVYGGGIYLDVGEYEGDGGKITVDDAAMRKAMGDNMSTGFKNSNYNFQQVSGLKVTAKDITFDVSGNKTYGDETKDNGEGYTIAITNGALVGDEKIGALTSTNGKVDAGADNGNVDIKILNTATDGSDSANDANKGIYLDVGSYGTRAAGDGEVVIDNFGDFAIVDNDGKLTQVAVTNGKVFKASNYNITQTSKYDVDKKAVTVTTITTKDYGDENPTNNNISYDTTGMLDRDVTDAHLNNDYTGDKPSVDNTTKYTDAGNYGTVNGGSQVLVTTVDASVAKNYDITYADDLKINKVDLNVKITDSKTYGEADATDGFGYKIEVSGLKNDETFGGLAAGAAGSGLASGDHLADAKVIGITNAVHDGDAGIYASNTYLDAGHYDSADNGSIEINNWDKLSTLDSESEKGFNANNYNIHTTYDYTVNKANLNADIVGEKTYGDPTSTSGNDYKITMTGLVNDEAIGGIGDKNQGKLPNVVIDNKLSPQGTYLNVKVDANGNVIAYEDVLTVRASELGKYDSADTNGFKIDNYELTSQGDYTVKRRPVDVNITGSKIFGTDTSTDGKDYNIYINGLVNGDKLGGLGNHNGVGTGGKVYHFGDTTIDSTGGKNLPVGSYFNTITLDGIEIVNGVYQTRNYTINSTSTYRVDPNKDPEAESNHTLGHGGDRKPVMLDIVYLDVQGSGIAVDMSNLSVPTVDAGEAVAPVELATSNIPADNANAASEALAKYVAVQAVDAENTISDEEEQKRKKAAK